MTEKHTELDPAKLSAREATGSKPVRGMPFVLGLSTLAIIVILAIVFAFFV